jgi:hypothetical protein
MTYDVFLSHNTADKPAVRHLKECLSSRGIKCWFDEADLQSGSNWMAQMEDGLRQSRCCAIFYGPSGVGPWHEMERQLAQLMAAEAWRAGQRFGIIPVRLPDAPEWRMLALPQFLRLYTSVDFPSLSDSSALNLLIAGILQEAPPPEEPDLSRPPYIGMRPFTEADSSVYSSRSNYVLHIAERIQRAEIPRFLSVLGASGGGKSSLLNAGVLPHLRQGTIYPSTKDWSYVTLRPGSDAWSNLRAAMAGHPLLMPLVTYVPSSIEKWLHEVASAAVGNQQGGRRFVLIVDQFEELFTSLPQGGSAAEQKRRENYLSNSWRPFAQNLAYAARETSGPVYVLISMRSDFLGYFADDEDLGPLLADAHQRCVIQPLSEQEVRASIERPAVARKVNFETALVEAVVQDYLLDPQGALPFLQEALLRVWQKGGRTRLALSDYREFGGLQGAVNAHADAMLERFQKESPEKVILIPPIFIHLTRLADDGPDTKRRRPLAELPGGEPAQALARELATEDYRLLVLGDWSPQPGERENPDPSGPADVVDKHEKASVRPTAAVEIAHESLLVGWQKLKSWLNDKQGHSLS